MIPEIPKNGLTMILGGARSGKSSFVERIARDSGKSVLFIATASAGDDEMAGKIHDLCQNLLTELDKTGA